MDHIVWELAGRPSARTAKTQFPIFETEARFTERGTKQFLKGVSSNAIRLIKSEQPFSARKDGTIEGTRSPLWHLKELSDTDKHRMIHVTACMLAAFNLEFPKVAEPFQLIDASQYEAGPIQQDTILMSVVLKGASDWPFAKGDTKAGFAVEVTFEDGTPSPGAWGVISTLAESGNRAEHVLRRISTKILKVEL